jgi:hypothetical protein
MLFVHVFDQFSVDRCGIGARTTCPFLVPLCGSWHFFKQASQVLWRAAAVFIAPLFHHFNPQSRYKRNRKSHTSNTWWFTVILMSYAKWRDDIESLVSDADFKAAQPVLHDHAKNLMDLCQFFIPTVKCSCFCVIVLESFILMP